MSEHTPTPWEVATGHPSRGLFVLGPPDEHDWARQVCEVDKAEDMDANAAFIVRAVNAHAALLSALEAVEWLNLDPNGEAMFQCPLCLHFRREGHAPDCQLAAALRAADPD